MVISVQPEYLLTSEILRFIQGRQRTAIVSAETQSKGLIIVKNQLVCTGVYSPSQFAVSVSTFRRPDVLWVGPQGEAFRTTAEVRTHKTDDHVQQGTGRLLYTQSDLWWRENREHSRSADLNKNYTSKNRRRLYLSANKCWSDVEVR